LLLSKYGFLLPEEFQVHNPKTGQTVLMTAIEFVRMQQSPNHPHSLQQLSASGVWAPVDTPPAPSSGFTHRE
ncbi:MAG TPA: hypothetical protein DDY37_02010, partial [Legionella sp.]|nr:hypothetical protein [Legionella sp.]